MPTGGSASAVSVASRQLERDEEVAVLVICTVPPPPDEPTANFLAP